MLSVFGFVALRFAASLRSCSQQKWGENWLGKELWLVAAARLIGKIISRSRNVRFTKLLSCRVKLPHVWVEG